MRRLLLYIGLVLAVAGATGPALAQQGGRYYPETGHTLDARFVEFYDSHGGLRILGYPLTIVFQDPVSGYEVQYMQNARLELVPDRETGQLRVNASPLGELMGGWEDPLPPDQWPLGSSAGCQYYPDSGHNVCYAFLEFFERNGGPELFGFPISEFKLENGRIVQYTQGFRLDWHPDSPFGPQVQVAPLGHAHFKAMGYPAEYATQSGASNQLGHRVVELRAGASVAQPVLRSTDRQEVYVRVHDQTLQPVAGASVTLFVDFGAEERTFILPPTDAAGLTRLAFAFENEQPGTLVTLEFSIVYDGFLSTVRDSFLIWW